MKIAPDTNVLIRAVIPVGEDGSEDARQSKLAKAMLERATLIVVSLPTLCEFAWVLRSGYRFDRTAITTAMRLLLNVSNLKCDRETAETGLRHLAEGGDFADGVIAESGFLAGADQFVSFDKRAVRLVAAGGRSAIVPN